MLPLSRRGRTLSLAPEEENTLLALCPTNGCMSYRLGSQIPPIYRYKAVGSTLSWSCGCFHKGRIYGALAPKYPSYQGGEHITRSSNQGGAWASLVNSGTAPCYSCISTKDSILFRNLTHVVCSKDEGYTWTNSLEVLTYPTGTVWDDRTSTYHGVVAIRRNSFLDLGEGALAFLDMAGDLSLSYDYGSSWVAAPSPPSSGPTASPPGQAYYPYYTALLSDGDGGLLAFDSVGNLYQAAAPGSSWGKVVDWPRLSSTNSYPIVLSGDTSPSTGTVLASTVEGIFRRPPGGVWSPAFSFAGIGGEAHNVRFDMYGTAYVVRNNKTRAMSVMFSPDDGNTWDDLPSYSNGPWTGSVALFLGDSALLQEFEVSMLCYDGSDGKGNAFQLHLGSDVGISYNHSATWSTSDPTRAVVSPTGVVSAVAGGSGDVTISCTYGGTTSTSLFTVYQTMPSTSELYMIKGGSGVGSAAGDYLGVSASFSSDVAIRSDLNSNLVHIRYATRQIGDYHWYFLEPFLCANKASYSCVAPLINSYLCSDIRGTYELTTRLTLYKDRHGHHLFPKRTPVDVPVLTREYITRTTPTGYIDGTSYTSIDYNTAGSSGSYLVYQHQNGVRKVTRIASSYQALSSGTSFSRASCELHYTPQNYIRYEDGRTVVPNIGTWGSDYDLTAYDVPGEWYEV